MYSEQNLAKKTVLLLPTIFLINVLKNNSIVVTDYLLIIVLYE